jgi:hypothetical protein
MRSFFIQRMEYDQSVIIRFLCKEGASPEDIHARLEAQLGDATDSERSVRQWCQYVRQGREDLHDELRSSRPPIDFLDIRILALPDEQPFHSAYSIAESLGVPHSTILSHLRESLSMKMFPLQAVQKIPGPIPISTCNRHKEANFALSVHLLSIILSDPGKTPDPVLEHDLDVVKSEVIPYLCNRVLNFITRGKPSICDDLLSRPKEPNVAWACIC